MGLKLNIVLLIILVVGGYLAVNWMACQTGYLKSFFSCPLSPLELFLGILRG